MTSSQNADAAEVERIVARTLGWGIVDARNLLRRLEAAGYKVVKA